MNRGQIDQTHTDTILGKVLGRILPNRTKRLIFVGSLIAHIQNCNTADKALISKLNTLLHLCGDENALMLPMQLHQKIWRNVNIDQLFEDKGFQVNDDNGLLAINQSKYTSKKIRTLSEDIIKIMPNWLKYSSNNRMRQDLITLLFNIGDITQTAKT